MPVPTSISDLSQTPSSNSPVGTEIVGPDMNQYIQAAYAFIAQLNATMNPSGVLTAPSGTRLVMQQSAAPAGWTVDTSAPFTDAAMRFNQSTGTSASGANAFSAVLVNGSVNFTTGSTAITTGQMPTHNHGVSDPGHAHGVADPGHNHGVNDGGHTHSGPATSFVGNTGSSGVYSSGSGGSTQPATGNSQSNISLNPATTAIGIYGASTGISTQNNGSGQGHTHSFASALNVKYADCIVAIKS